jgi:hypothetical protein
MTSRPSVLRVAAVALIIVLSGAAAVTSSGAAGKDGWIMGCTRHSALTQVDDMRIYTRQ